MSKKILIDASVSNETRIALINNDKLEECEIESNTKTRIKSNVYLAKISRVEASLQAAFVDFGGNKHGFLPFTEIHPDYFKIPVSDQKKLKELISINENEEGIEKDKTENEDDIKEKNEKNIKFRETKENKKKLFFNFFKKYKIQEVIKPRQVLLVQVSKEERGLKGAALTTFLSFAGRYCVLMPNSNNSIGISRKISDQTERKKLKEILDSINIPDGMSVIIRTAGIGKNKKEIAKDLNFLIDQWIKIRELTLKSNAPALIYEEGDIIKRTIRDLFSKEISAITIDGKDSYAKARKYMKTIMPNQLNKIKLHKTSVDKLFNKHNLEKQIDELYGSEIKLTSGGSIVINVTEALVAIDVNSGKATQQRNIENTALNTNLEASVEIIRQLKLRDLAGLVVVDFIDMEDYRNNFKVEKSIRTAASTDRARIQIGRISPFGLLELSRQRLRTSIIEYTSEKCQLCNGTGMVRNTKSISEQLFRMLDEYCSKKRKSNLEIRCNSHLADEILNNKKNNIIDLEKKYDCSLNFSFDNFILLNKPEIKYKSDNQEKEKNTTINKKETRKIKKIPKKHKEKKLETSDSKKNINIDNDDTKNLTADEFENDEAKKGWWSQSST